MRSGYLNMSELFIVTNDESPGLLPFGPKVMARIDIRLKYYRDDELADGNAILVQKCRP